MNVNDIYPSKYVKAHDLGDKTVTVTIKSAVMESLGYGKEAERKLVIYFERATKGLILNRTNAMIIASLYSPETDNWIGKAIILYSARIKAFGAWADAVRVKETIPARNMGAAQVPDALQEEPLDDENDLLDVDEGAPPRVDPDTGEILDGKIDGDVVFGKDEPPTDEEHDTISIWQTPQDAYTWAVNVGACENEHEARNSFAKIVEAHGGRLSKLNKAAIFLAFLRRQQTKLEAVV